MSGRLKPGRPVGAEIMRVAGKQLDAVLVTLTLTNPSDQDIRMVRKRLKSMRALVALADGGLGRDRARSEAVSYRDAGRCLSARRDEAARLEAIDRLAQRFPPNSPFTAGTVLADLRQSLAREGAEPFASSGSDVRAAFAVVVTARSRVPSWGLDKSEEGWSLLEPGLHRTYRSARRGALALNQASTEEARHSVRREVKLYVGQLELLRRALNEEFRAQMDAGRELARVLGEDHDLELLRQFVETLGDPYDTALAPVIARERGRLQARADVLVGQVFSTKAGQLVPAIGAQWEASACVSGAGRQRS